MGGLGRWVGANLWRAGLCVLVPVAVFAPASAAGLRLPGAEPFSVGDHLGLTIVFGGAMLPIYLALVATRSSWVARSCSNRSPAGHLHRGWEVQLPLFPDGAFTRRWGGRVAIVNDRGNDVTGEGINLDTASQYWVDGDRRRFSIRYDALNSITPVGISVDGRVTFEAGPDGRLRIVGDDRDDYPSQGIYQYLPGGETIVVDRMDEEGVFCGALPVC